MKIDRQDWIIFAIVAISAILAVIGVSAGWW
jgi:hypothetical protein